jgi:hypothetical protein
VGAGARLKYCRRQGFSPVRAVAQVVGQEKKPEEKTKCGNPFEMLAELVEQLFKRHGQAGIQAYDEFAKLAAKKGVGKYEVYEFLVEVKENEICITEKA